ncbi:MAG: DUF494 family protein [Burkholderiaceae bacterium]|nr:DUF494 family protein [Burkholderiaceae bacterium]
MFDVLVYLYENFPALTGTPDADALARKLSAAGFDKDEITDALSWLQGLARRARSYAVERAATAQREPSESTPVSRVEPPGPPRAMAFVRVPRRSTACRDGAQREIIDRRALAMVGQQ